MFIMAIVGYYFYKKLSNKKKTEHISMGVNASLNSESFEEDEKHNRTASTFKKGTVKQDALTKCKRHCDSLKTEFKKFSVKKLVVKDKYAQTHDLFTEGDKKIPTYRGICTTYVYAIIVGAFIYVALERYNTVDSTVAKMNRAKKWFSSDIPQNLANMTSFYGSQNSSVCFNTEVASGDYTGPEIFDGENNVHGSRDTLPAKLVLTYDYLKSLPQEAQFNPPRINLDGNSAQEEHITTLNQPCEDLWPLALHVDDPETN